MGGRSREAQRTYRAKVSANKIKLDTIRSIPLSNFAAASGLKQDRNDKKQFFTESGERIAITNDLFYNFDREQGGKGAVDLQMHLTGQDFKEAVKTLGDIDYDFTLQPVTTEIKTAFNSTLPERAASSNKARDYLINTRGLDASIVDSAIALGQVYQDDKNNVVFKAGNEGAEIKGTGDKSFRGSRGIINEGFAIEAEKPQQIVLVESAIDALSYKQLHGEGDTIISLGGNVNRAVMLQAIEKSKSEGVPLVAAFDNDKGGDIARASLNAIASASDVPVHDHRPSTKDWNTDLKNK